MPVARRSRAFWVIIVVAIVLVAVAVMRIVTRGGSARRPRRQNTSVVRVEIPLRDTVTYTLQSTGDVVAMQAASVVTRVGGSLDRVNANIGDRVRAGQSLAFIDTTELAFTAQQTGATFAVARAAYERASQLLAANLVSRQDFDNVEAAMRVAEANSQTAQARLGYANITAPFAGTVTARQFDPGAVVSVGTALFTLADFDSVKVVINVLEKDVPLVMVGTRAKVVAGALPTDTFAGRVGRTSDAVDPATRTMRAEIFVANPEHRLKPGMYATANLFLFEHPDAITIPAAAVLRAAGDTFVYVVERDTARRKLVRTGIEQGARTEIVSGLAGDESLITTGQQYVKDASPVTVQP
ncbi:MAG: efflux RND transporter periplasmic adaptor subunit [candidate division WOR-3 bacterium]|nr:efflux RND transporter periplasmic adaptor subunit [candidate division WOR-3 bacterium]